MTKTENVKIDQLELIAPDNRNVVKYGPDLNAVAFPKFNAVNFDIFFAVLAAAVNQHDKVLRIDLATLKKIAKKRKANRSAFIKQVIATYRKLLDIRWHATTNGNFEESIFFSGFKVVVNDNDNNPIEHPYVELQIAPDAIPLLNDLSRWVSYSLGEFINLKSKYAKSLYRLLMQYKSTGYYTVHPQVLRELLSVPKSYNANTFYKQTLAPAVKELSPYFKDLKLKETRGPGKGKPIVKYTFSWLPAERKEAKTHQRRTGHVEPLPDWAKKNRTKPQPQKQREVTPEEIKAKLKQLQELREKRQQSKRGENN